MIVSFNLNEIVSSKLEVISDSTGISVDELLSRICSELVNIVSDIGQINVSSALAILPEALEDQIIATMEDDQLADTAKENRIRSASAEMVRKLHRGWRLVDG